MLPIWERHWKKACHCRPVSLHMHLSCITIIIVIIIIFFIVVVVIVFVIVILDYCGNGRKEASGPGNQKRIIMRALAQVRGRQCS